MTGDKGMTGDPGGDTGPTGPAAENNTLIFFGSDQSTSNMDYLGLGNSSSNYFRSSIVIPVNGTITTIVGDLRGQTHTDTTFTLWKDLANGGGQAATSLSVTVLADDDCDIGVGSVSVAPCDTLSVQVTKSGGALNLGAGATILINL